MPITYKIDVMQELSNIGYSTYRLRKEGILSPSTIKCLQEKQPISFETLAKLCELLNLQPSDIIAYTPISKEESLQDEYSNIDEFFRENPDFRKDYVKWKNQKHND